MQGVVMNLQTFLPLCLFRLNLRYEKCQGERFWNHYVRWWRTRSLLSYEENSPANKLSERSKCLREVKWCYWWILHQSVGCEKSSAQQMTEFCKGTLAYLLLIYFVKSNKWGVGMFPSKSWNYLEYVCIRIQ